MLCSRKKARLVGMLTTCMTMNNGHTIPVLGFGTWQSPDGDVATASVLTALEAGYRHIDTAAVYGNERSVGKGIAQSGVPREELFITTKLWNNMRGRENVLTAFEASMEKLQLDYLDLYLVHWPANTVTNPDDWKQLNASTWQGMEELLTTGRVRSIGLSNFMPEHLHAIMETAVVKPVINQVEYHPGHTQPAVLAANKECGLITQAWSPMGRAQLFTHPVIVEIAQRYQRSAAQVCLRYCLQNNTIPLPKSDTPSRIIENTQLWDFELSLEDMAAIDAMSSTAYSGGDPYTATFM